MKITLKGALMGALITTAGAAAVVGHTIYGVEPSAQGGEPSWYRDKWFSASPAPSAKPTPPTPEATPGVGGQFQWGRAPAPAPRPVSAAVARGSWEVSKSAITAQQSFPNLCLPSAQAAAATESTWWGVKIPSGLRCNEAGAR